MQKIKFVHSRGNCIVPLIKVVVDAKSVRAKAKS